MKKYTIQDLENSPSTITKFFVLQGKAELNMIDDAYEFYVKFSTHNREKGKTFTKKFIKSMDFYNSVK